MATMEFSSTVEVVDLPNGAIELSFKAERTGRGRQIHSVVIRDNASASAIRTAANLFKDSAR